MQTKSQIEDLLFKAGVRPNKRFGQNFLIDLNLMRLLIDTANIQKNDVVLEVGTGTGSLTLGIAEKAGYCVSVEIDEVLANIAKGQLADKSNVEIITADALKNKFEINPVVIDALNRAVSRASSPARPGWPRYRPIASRRQFALYRRDTTDYQPHNRPDYRGFDPFDWFDKLTTGKFRAGKLTAGGCDVRYRPERSRGPNDLTGGHKRLRNPKHT